MKDGFHYISETQYQLLEDAEELYNNAPVGYLSFLPDGTIIRINKRLLSWLDLRIEEVLNRLKFSDLFTIGGKIYYQNHVFPLLMMQGFVNEVNFELSCRDKSIKPVLVNALTIKDKFDHPLNFRATITDISDRKKYENQLLYEKKKAETERQRFKLITDLLPELVVTTDHKGSLHFANIKALKYFGTYEANSIYDFFNFVFPAHRFLLLLNWKRSLSRIVPLEKEVRLLNAIGKYEWYLVKAIPYKEEESGDSRWLWVGISISNQKHLVSKMDEFLSIASHELKSPLTTTKAYLQLLLRNYSDHTIRKYVNKTNKQVEKLEILIKDLLDVSKIQADQMQFRFEMASVNGLLIDTIEALKTFSETHKIELKTLKEDVVVSMDRMRMEQVIINLVNNGIKYSPDSSKISVAIEKHAHYVVISVSDYGIGIPSSEVNLLFERFYRVTNALHVSGLGMGLYISQQIVHKHGGEIKVVSEVGKGSTFSIYLPVHS